MSSHPNTYVAAVFTTIDGSDISTVLEKLEEDDIRLPNGELYSVIRYDNENGIDVEENSFAIHSYATYGWGESCNLDKIIEHVGTKTAEAKHVLEYFPELKYTIRIGADWF